MKNEKKIIIKEREQLMHYKKTTKFLALSTMNNRTSWVKFYLCPRHALNLESLQFFIPLFISRMGLRCHMNLKTWRNIWSSNCCFSFMHMRELSEKILQTTFIYLIFNIPLFKVIMLRIKINFTTIATHYRY